MTYRLSVRHTPYRLAGTFSISRGSRTVADTLVVTIAGEGLTGRGECVPYARYGESLDGVRTQIEAIRPAVEEGLDRALLQRSMPAGAARNAIDCALWDLEAKRQGCRVWELAGLPAPEPVETVYTLSLDTPERMAAAAKANADKPALKLKLTGDGDLDRVTAVREHAPAARIIVDANEAWRPEHLDRFLPALADLGVAMVEQPLPADRDEALRGYDSPVPVGADESCHDRASLDALVGKYRVVNIKLDKTGGLTEALALRKAAREHGFEIMVGCMMASSLAMAPAHLVAQGARFVDLDGPLWLAEDVEPPLTVDGVRISPPAPALWG